MPLINFSGLASGIDSEALIEAITEARTAQRITPNEEDIAELEDENSALDELRTLLTELQDLALDFTSLNGGAVAKQADSSDETLITALANNSAVSGTYEVTVSQLAENATFSWDTPTFGDINDVVDGAINDGDPAANRTVSFTVGSGASAETVDIVMTSTMTAADWVSEFNSNSNLASANLVNVGSTTTPDYAIVITTKNVGLEKGQITVPPTVGSSISVWNTPPTGQYSVDQAQDAEFSVSGIAGTISRSSNTVTDVIPNVTLSLEGVDALSPVTITVEDDVSTTVSRVQEFGDKYNEIVEFINENNLISRDDTDPDALNVFGPLASTRVDDGVLTALRAAITGSSYSNGTEIKIFADLGFETQRDGTLKLDPEDLEEAISKEPDSVAQILANFGDEVAVTGGVIDQYIRFNGLLDITTDGNDDQIDDLNERIARAQASIDQEVASLRRRFAALESLVGRLQSEQSALTSALAGLG